MKLSRRKLLFLVNGLLIIILLILLAIFMRQETRHDTSIGEKPAETYRDFNKYVFTYRDDSPYAVFDRVMYPDLIPGQEIIWIELPNNDFESASGQSVVNSWTGLNTALSNENCLAGNSCIIINRTSQESPGKKDSTWAILNSAETNVTPGIIYGVRTKVDCKICENSSVYAAMIWLKPSQDDVPRSKEFKRNILVLNNTKGYEELIVIARAPEGAEKLIFGIRAQKEAANVASRSLLYIDSE